MVTWDLAHNGASCAFMLADLLSREYEVELVGPTFLGTEIWEPIREARIPTRTFPGRGLPQFIEDAERAVGEVEADVVYACKPRFPTLLLSMLIKDQCGAPVIVHIDDFEPGLVGAEDSVSLDELARHRGAREFADPAGQLWVSACEQLIDDADAITVSGATLRRRYGGPSSDSHGTSGNSTRPGSTGGRFVPSSATPTRIASSCSWGRHDRTRESANSPRRWHRPTMNGSSSA